MQFKQPITFLESVAQIAKSESVEPSSILDDAKEVVAKLIAADVLVRVSSMHKGIFKAITPQFKVGDVFRTYRILKIIHFTTDTEIYQVEDMAHQKLHALKIMRPHHSQIYDTNSIRKMLENEFKVLSLLEGTAACHLVESGLFHSLPYGILEWIEGIPLAQFSATLRQEEYLGSRTKLLELSLECVQALSTIHDKGYFHGDIHPGNFLVESDGHVRLIDFGLSQIIAPKAKRALLTGGVVQFVSPEYALAMVSHQKDILMTMASEVYSLGAVLYYILTGNYPLDLAPTRDEALFEISEKPVKPFQHVGIRPWKSVELVLLRAMRKDPKQRFLSLRDLRSALKCCSVITTNEETQFSNSTQLKTKSFLEHLVKKYLSELSDLSYSVLESSQEPPHANLAFGGAGIAYALLRAAKYFGNGDLLAQAYQWIGYSLKSSRKPTAFAAPSFGLQITSVNPSSFYYGVAGIHFVRALVANAMNDKVEQLNAVNSFRSLISKSKHIVPELLLGKSGQLLGIVHLKADIGETSLDVVGQRLFDELIKMPLTNVPFNGFAHGVGGIYFSLLEWSRISGTPLPEQFWSTLRDFAKTGQWDGDSVRWTIQNDGLMNTYMHSWCNGTPGLTLLWEKAYQISKDPYFLQIANACGHEMLGNSGENVSHLCCGDAGQSYAFLALSRLDARWTTHATKIARKAINEEKFDHWEYSLFKGKSGLLCLALDLLNTRTSFPCVEVSL